jgi:hypothetical protein
MNRDYEIFERFPDSTLRSLARVHGTRNVPQILEERGKQTTNECFAKNIRTGEIIARVNDKPAQRAKLVERSVNAGEPGSPLQETWKNRGVVYTIDVKVGSGFVTAQREADEKIYSRMVAGLVDRDETEKLFESDLSREPGAKS